MEGAALNSDPCVSVSASLGLEIKVIVHGRFFGESVSES